MEDDIPEQPIENFNGESMSQEEIFPKANATNQLSMHIPVRSIYRPWDILSLRRFRENVGTTLRIRY